MVCWFRAALRKVWLVIGLVILAPLASAQQPINVLASIKPLQLVAQAITADVLDTQVLLPTGVTPHDYALKPSDLKRVYASDVLLWLGPEAEAYLAKPGTMLRGEQLVAWQAGDDEHEQDQNHHSESHDGHHHLRGDPHIWFDPEQAKQIARQLTQLLTAIDRQNARRYQHNLSSFLERVAQKDIEIKAQLTKKIPNYLVAHDAYSHFENHYGLQHVAAISDTPESKPGARGLLKLRKQIIDEQIQCLFVEPQTDPRIVAILAEGNALQVYTLDPMATDIEFSATGYEHFLQHTADRFAQCHW